MKLKSIKYTIEYFNKNIIKNEAGHYIHLDLSNKFEGIVWEICKLNVVEKVWRHVGNWSALKIYMKNILEL